MKLSKSLESERIGMINTNTYGTNMEIIKNYNKNNIVIKFENGYITSNTYPNFISGRIRSLNDKTIYKTGFVGIGEYNESCSQYIIWKSMLHRCYSNKYHKERMTYLNCSVCTEWHNFQNFAKWYDENYYEINNESMCLDKDILMKGNKIYSPNTCVFVPNTINVLFVKSNAIRGLYPIGVSYNKDNKKYRAYCLVNNKQIHLGKFNTQEEAFNTYKTFKEKHIKQVADEYKDLLPQKLYDAMYNYEVEITD